MMHRFKRDKFSFYGELDRMNRRLLREFVPEPDAAVVLRQSMEDWMLYATVGKDRRKLDKRKYGEPRLAKIEADIREQIEMSRRWKTASA